MPRFPARLVIPALAATFLAACGGAGSSPAPSAEPSPPGDAKALLRVTMVQALPPMNTFGLIPAIVVTLDGRVLSGGAVPAIFPGPLVMPIIERKLTPAGWAQIVAAARAAGLLSGQRDFTGGAMPPGSVTARLELVADGRLYDLIGDPNKFIVCVKAPCIPAPGTPEAFGTFINNLTMLDSWLAADLGPQGSFAPPAYALIVGPPPNQQGLEQPILPWPLADGLAALGKPLSDGSGSRCGLVTGDAAAALRPAFGAANQLTRWRDPADGSLRGLTVRPLLPGDADPCAGLV
ncbi:MAG TPA: hypothetical protein VIU37_01320 [Candidatus Limnocylindrales bacterium]